MNKIARHAAGMALLILILPFFAGVADGQIQLYLETFSSVMAPNLPGAWSANTSEIFTASNSVSNYGGASGGNNLLSRNCISAGGAQFSVSGISTQNAGGIAISFGHRRTNCFTPPVTLQWSDDGVFWNTIVAYSIPSTASVWSVAGPFILPFEAENKTNLSFRWTYTAVNPGGTCSAAYGICSDLSGNFRIDDFKVTATTLPVELSLFTATLLKKEVILRWQTQSETNSDLFQIQRSKDGRDFEAIGEVEAAGFSTQTLDYQFIDKSPLNGVNYYRLKQVDFDGQSRLSPIASINYNVSNKAAVFPTMVQETVYIKFSEETKESGLVQLIDMMGRLAGSYDLEAGLSEYQLSTSGVPNGQYLLRIMSGRVVETYKIFRMKN